MADNDSYAKDVEELFEEKEIQSDDPIIQKCLDIIRNKKVTVKDLPGLGYYNVYLGNKKCFMIHKDFLIGVGTVYTMNINNQDYRFCGKRPDLKELHRLCVSTYNEQSQEREKSTLDFLNDVDRGEKTKTDKRLLTPGQRTGILFMFAGLTFAAAGVISYKGSEKKERGNKQVEAFEKTLPAEYLEYKQAVEHYRDSLMNVKGK